MRRSDAKKIQMSFTIYACISLESTLHGNGQRNKDINAADIPVAMQVN